MLKKSQSLLALLLTVILAVALARWWGDPGKEAIHTTQNSAEKIIHQQPPPTPEQIANESTKTTETGTINIGAHDQINKDTPREHMEIDGLIKSTAAENGASDIEAKNEFEKTPLMVAAGEGNAELVKELLDKGADVNAKTDTLGRTAMIIAARYGQSEVVDILLRAGADVNVQTTMGCTALLHASAHGHSEVVGTLLSNNAETDAQTTKGYTPLMEATKEGHSEIVKMLLKHGANVNITDISGKTADDYATKEETHALIHELLK
ncbi:MAG: ankyrin repeat domain-containing protein [Proteobacteria bacterium]|nr:ankyrin repeat domain-containing protein [Desulfobulbaceae bacterium]MBU4152551.1 ankyrin repeat domain-containing protein [Pseudomonadota bacterium]